MAAFYKVSGLLLCLEVPFESLVHRGSGAGILPAVLTTRVSCIYTLEPQNVLARRGLPMTVLEPPLWPSLLSDDKSWLGALESTPSLLTEIR